MEGKVQGLNKDSKYAYGFSDELRNGVRVVGHNGGIPGYWGPDQVREKGAVSRSEKLLINGYGDAVPGPR
ncbi:hypothetical protein [Nonomuraea sp. JJY05]|jgi:hypothetical protein|uniref:hypothetical protein n=1 Tax=Nonomuraea sp. JJY05 TaxID=3350255 RepID=UPI00373FBA32